MGNTTLPVSIAAPSGWADTQLPSSAPASNDGITDLIKSAQSLPTPSVPMYQQQTSTPSPHVTPPQMKQMVPMAGYSMRDAPGDRTRGRVHNNLATFTNALNTYTNRKKTEEYNVLTKNIVDIMKAQQQISNAEAVLKSDPNNADAKAVIEQNKKFIDGKFEDKKMRKQYEKAFDMSFTDPQKNNTPEVKAGQAAIKAVQAATQAGLDHNTPQEKKVAEDLNKPVQQQQQAAPPTGGQVADGSRSSTPYADQFLKSGPAALEPNPLYQQQLKQLEARDKMLNQYVIPKIIDTMARKEIASMKEQGLENRAEYKQYKEDQRKILDLATKTEIADSRNKAMLQGVAMRNQTMLKATYARIASAEKMNSDPRFKQNGIKTEAISQALLGKIDQDIATITKQNETLGNLKLLNSGDKEKASSIEQAIKINDEAIKQMQSRRTEIQTKIMGTPEGNVLKGNSPNARATVTTANGPTDDSEDEFINEFDFGKEDDRDEDVDDE